MVKDVSQMLEILGIPKKSLSIPTDSAPQTLWHYTSRDGLWGILEANLLRATHSSFLNDTSEVAKVYRKLLDKFEPEMTDERKKTSSLSDFLSSLEKRLPDNGSECKSVYVISMTDAGDSLPHWTGYTKRQTGDVAIGFKVNENLFNARFEEKSCNGTPRFFIQQCLYYSGLDEILNKVAERLRKFFVDDLSSLDDARIKELIKLGSALAQAQHLLPCLKNKSFEYEREWRIYACLLNKNQKTESQGISFVNGRPYLPVKLSQIGVITDIIVSPYGNSEEGLLYCKMLKQLGWLGEDVNIRSSGATIR